MNKAHFYSLIEKPSAITSDDVIALNKLIEAFPYFYPARQLLLFYHKNHNDIHFQSILEKEQVYFPDKEKLYDFLYQNNAKTEAIEEIPSKSEENDFIETRNTDVTVRTFSQQPETQVSEEFVNTLNPEPEITNVEPEIPQPIIETSNNQMSENMALKSHDFQPETRNPDAYGQDFQPEILTPSDATVKTGIDEDIQPETQVSEEVVNTLNPEPEITNVEPEITQPIIETSNNQMSENMALKSLDFQPETRIPDASDASVRTSTVRTFSQQPETQVSEEIVNTLNPEPEITNVEPEIPQPIIETSNNQISENMTLKSHDFQPETRNPDAYGQDFQPEILTPSDATIKTGIDEEILTLNGQDFQPETQVSEEAANSLNSEPEITNVEPEIPQPIIETSNNQTPENLTHNIQNFQPETRNPDAYGQDFQPEILTLQSGLSTQNPKPETKNQKPETIQQTIEPTTMTTQNLECENKESIKESIADVVLRRINEIKRIRAEQAQEKTIPVVTSKVAIDEQIKEEVKNENYISEDTVTNIPKSLEKEISQDKQEEIIESTLIPELDKLYYKSYDINDLLADESGKENIEENPSNQSFTSWLEFLDKSNTLVNEKSENKPIKKEKSDILIEKFIEEKPKIRISSESKETNRTDFENNSDEEEDIVSEFLAQLLEKQGYYEKAKKMYEKLSLINPEKSIYFATRIEKLNELLNLR